MLYSCEHIRPNNKLTIAVVVSGVPEEWHKEVNPVIYLGGEGRVVSLTVKDENLPLPNYPVLKLKNGLLCYTVTLITPAYYEDVEKLKEVLTRGMLAFPGQCVSACLGKLEQVGGWDIENCCPRPLHPLIPAGSTWFFEAKETELQEISKLHGQFIGDRNNYGFGQILIGRWEKKTAHYILYKHLQDWLCRDSKQAPYQHGNLMQAITTNDRESYMHAQAEALAWLQWQKKFAVAYLKSD